MFAECNKLSTFIIPSTSLSNLYYADAMFLNCNKLTTFNGNLENLENAPDMFAGCALNKESILHISETIADISDASYRRHKLVEGKLGPIGLLKEDCTNENGAPLEEVTSAINKIKAKGWICEIGGFNSLASILNNSNIFYVHKTKGNADSQYKDSENNYWNLSTYTNVPIEILNDDYKLVSSIEEGAEYFNLTKLELNKE